MENTTKIDKASGKVEAMFSSIANRYDLTNTVLSMGIHHLWRKKVLASLKDNPIARAIDICTGTGDLLPGLNEKYSEVVGLDFCQEMLDYCDSKLPKENKVQTIKADALNMPFENNYFSAATVSFGVRNFENLENGIKEIYRVLEDEAELRILEFGRPYFPVSVTYDIYSKYIMPLLGQALTKSKEAYTYLPETAKNFPYGDNFCEILRKQGFKDVSYKALTFGIAYMYSASK